MPLLASFTGKTAFESPEITIPATGAVKVFINGSLGPRASVLIKLKGVDGPFHAYPELTFARAAALELGLEAGDKIKVQFVNCTAAGVEVRQ